MKRFLWTMMAVTLVACAPSEEMSDPDVDGETTTTAEALTATPVPLATGGDHTCAIVTGGALKCWGKGTSGQLGNNSIVNSSVPVQVTGLTSGVVAVTAGYAHTCALTSAGGVKCWGRNNLGQLGNLSTADAYTPVDVYGLSSGVAAISAGNQHTCALTTGGGVKCWGRNEEVGLLGNGSTVNSASPVDVTGLSSGVVSLNAGYMHTCVVTTAGAIKCWGSNIYGVLGNGMSSPSAISTPYATSLTSGMLATSQGTYRTCALSAAGGLKCWGSNEDGMLGNGSTVSSLTPVQVTGLSSGVAAVAGNYSHTCALTTAGAVSCWGRGYEGQIGNNTNVSSKVPAPVTDLSSGVVSLYVGSLHSCARLSSGALKCWGNNSSGQLGDGTTTSRRTPVTIPGI